MRAAVLGSPIAHSKSPALHRAAYEAAGLTDWTYEAIELEPSGFAAFFDQLDTTWAGLSLTMPLKDSVHPWVGYLSDTARVTGSINTIVFPQASGATHDQVAGYNTDVYGITQAFARRQFDHINRVLVLGAGATARSAVVAAQRMGATEVFVAARNPTRIDELQSLLPEIPVQRLALAELEQDFAALPPRLDAVISTLPAHAADPFASGLPQAECVGSATALLDVAYHPWPSMLARHWPGPVISGAAMLLWQAVAQVKLMTGIDPDHERMAGAIGLHNY